MPKVVNFNASNDLVNIVADFQMDIILELLDYRINNNIISTKSQDNKDYPKVITGCEYNQIRYPGRSFKGRSRIQRVKVLHSDIINALSVVAPSVTPPETIDDPMSGKTLYIGTCAEDDSATRVLNELDSKHKIRPKLNDLIFVHPYRPRTSVYVECCEVCVELFGK